MSERQNSHKLNLPGTESEADRAERREEAEEKATALRDEKLVEAATSGHGEKLVPHGNESKGQMLTVENVGRLEREVEKATGRRSPVPKQRSSSGEDMEASSDEARSKSKERPRMERRWKDSERTVKG